MTALELRPMTLADVDAVAALDRIAFGDSCWSRDHFVGELTESPISVLAVLVDRSQPDPSQRLVGYFGAWHIVDQLHLCTIAIDPLQQGNGLGAILLGCVLRLAQRLECETIQLEVRSSNASARSLYHSRGFVEQGIRRNLYEHPREHGVLMELAGGDAIDVSLRRCLDSRWQGSLALRWDDRSGQLNESWLTTASTETPAAIHLAS